MQSCHRQALTGAVFALCCLVLAAGTPAVSQAADNIGIWFDPAYTQNDLQQSTFPYFGEAYLVLHEPSLDGVGGWECQVATSGPVTLLTWTLEGQAANFTTPPEFVVGLGSPLPSGADVLLATVQFMIDAPAPVAFSLVPVYHASIPGEMAYIPFADPNILSGHDHRHRSPGGGLVQPRPAGLLGDARVMSPSACSRWGPRPCAR